MRHGRSDRGVDQGVCEGMDGVWGMDGVIGE